MIDIKLTPEEIVEARNGATFKKYKFNNAGATPAEFCIANEAQLKMLNLMKLEGLVEHDIYHSGMKGIHREDCKLCELEKELED